MFLSGVEELVPIVFFFISAVLCTPNPKPFSLDLGGKGTGGKHWNTGVNIGGHPNPSVDVVVGAGGPKGNFDFDLKIPIIQPPASKNPPQQRPRPKKTKKPRPPQPMSNQYAGSPIYPIYGSGAPAYNTYPGQNTGGYSFGQQIPSRETAQAMQSVGGPSNHHAYHGQGVGGHGFGHQMYSTGPTQPIRSINYGKIRVWEHWHTGISEIMDLSSGGCVGVPSNLLRRITSVDMNGNCAILFVAPDCKGKGVRLEDYSYGDDGFIKIGINDQVSSARMCTPSFVYSNN